MLNTRNIRVAAAAIFIFTVVGYLLFHAGSFPDASSRVQVGVSSENAIKSGSSGQQASANKGDDVPYTPSSGNTGSLADEAVDETANEADEKQQENLPKPSFGKTEKAPQQAGSNQADISKAGSGKAGTNKADTSKAGSSQGITKPVYKGDSATEAH
ncbi:hypothetical protein JCM33374_g4970 [Metschnikowia sp. JCM 33374]|nr:hypothetical protein JCM33374_g4970 [Metschnikowia sp. JCM 33374]